MKTYILRIYRFKKDQPRALVGVMEEVGVKGKRAFTNFDELWEILNSPRGVPQFSTLRNSVVRKKKGRHSRESGNPVQS